MFTQSMRIKMQRICLFLLCIVFLGFSAALAAEFSLIVEPEGHRAAIQTQKTEVEVKDLFKSAVRWRRVDLLKQLALTDGIVKGDELVLNLFPDTAYNAAVDRVSVNVQGTITIRGRLRNYPLGYVLISTTGDLSLASIRVPELGVEYTIVYDPDSRAHYLLDNDPLKMDTLEDAPAVIPPPPKPEEQREIKALQEHIMLNQVIDDSTVTIDVMVVYTPAARLWADSHGSISNVISQAMEKAQLVADNSGTFFTVRLIHSAEVAYTESGDSEIDLDRLQGSGDGYLESVHTLRNTYGADLVVLFTQINDVGGIGYLLASPSGTPAYGFSITRVQQASSEYTTIHEIGHNMGLGHHKGQNVQPGPGLFSYSAGWRWVGTDGGRYCSVMTYTSGQYYSDGMTHTRVPYFSNPSMTYMGTATGHATNGDNARTVREIKNVIAAYRQATPSCTYIISPTNALFGSSANTGTVTVTPSASSCTWSSASNALWITITAGSAATGTGTVSYSVSANTGTSSRSGTMTIGGQTFTVTQNGNTGTTLYFSHVASNVFWQTEIAIINTSPNQSVTGALKAFSDDGRPVENRDLSLSPRGRRQITVADEFTNHTSIAYIIFDATSDTVQGYTKYYREGYYRAAIPAVKEMNTSDIHISHIASNADWWTAVSLLNTTPAKKDLTITFNNRQSRLISLDANQHGAFNIAEQFFNNQPQPGIESAVITNASGIVGLELFGNIGGSNHLDGIPLTDKTAYTLYYPHVADDGWWTTSIVAYNPSVLECTITITPYNAQGTPLLRSTRSLAGRGKYVGTVADLGLPAQTAWFRIDSTRPLSGFELFSTADGNQLAAYTGSGGTGARTGVFPKIEKNGGWTGIAFVNTEAGAASVTLTAYNDNGTPVATPRVLPVGGYAKVVNLAEEIFSQDISGATYITYASDRNVVGFQLNGSADGMMLDGLPALAGTN
jgi:hypothetical protein